MANPDRLTALDSTFLHLEEGTSAHMHVASVMVFEGSAPTHQEIVDGISGVDVTTVLFDTSPEPARPARSTKWTAQPLPGPAKLLGEALIERTTVPNEIARGARALLRGPRKALSQVRDGLVN